VRAAPGVQRVGQVLVPRVAVADDRAGVTGEHASGVDVGGGPAAGVHRGQELGAGHVHIMQAPADAGGSLVGVQHPGLAQQQPDPVQERAQPGRGPGPHPGHEPRRDAHPGQRGQQPRRPRHRQVVRADRQRRLSMHQRPVLHAAGHARRGHALGHRPAARALLCHHLVLGHLRRRRGLRLEHLPLLQAHDRGVIKTGAAAPARGRAAFRPLIRIIGLLQRGRLRAGLLAAPAPGPAPQRPVPRLLRIRAVRRGRLGGVGGVLAQPALHLGEPLGQHRDLRPRRLKLGVPRRQLSVLSLQRLAQLGVRLAQRAPLL
jgi:hypothetical protein